ncbi:MAG: YraN family protein [Chlorobi bacterium]|nr:YraN family protein [Chlorobiota bacterium]
MSTHGSGRRGETIARRYLVENGYRIVAENFRFGRYGEIDLVAYDNDTLVFVEVKYRRSTQYGSPEESVTERKRATIRRIAEGFLYVHRHISANEYRFDVIAIEESSDGPIIRHWKNAFW